MKYYYINLNKDSKGFNEVHECSCYFLNIAENKRLLGCFNTAIDAVSYAKQYGYPKADGCYYCSNEAHHD